MTKKLSVYIRIADSFQTYHFMLPATMQVEVAQGLICSILNTVEQTAYVSAAYRMLSVSTGFLLAPSHTLQEAGVADGMHIVLVKEL